MDISYRDAYSHRSSISSLRRKDFIPRFRPVIQRCNVTPKNLINRMTEPLAHPFSRSARRHRHLGMLWKGYLTFVHGWRPANHTATAGDQPKNLHRIATTASRSRASRNIIRCKFHGGFVFVTVATCMDSLECRDDQEIGWRCNDKLMLLAVMAS